MRPCWIVALALVACARPFDNPLDPAGPGLPAPLAEQAGVHAVRLKVAPVAHPSVTSYAYFRSQEGTDPELAGEASAADPTFVDQAVSPGNSYAYTVRAKNASGVLSAPSPAVSVTVADTPSVELKATAVDIGRVELQVGPTVPWITAIELNRRSDADGSETKRAVAAGTTVPDDADEGVSWHYTLTPKDATGEAGPTTDVGLQLAWPAPTGISLERRLAIPDVVHLEWGPVNKAVGYVVEAAGSADTWDERGRPTATSFDAGGLSVRAQYRWRIRALGANGKTTVPSEVIFSYVPDWVRVLQGGVSDPLPGPTATARAALVQSTESGNLVYAAFATAQDRLQVFRRALDVAGPWRRVYDQPFNAKLPVFLQEDGPTVVFPFGRDDRSTAVVSQSLVAGSVEQSYGFVGGAPVARHDAPALLLSDHQTVFTPLGVDPLGNSFHDALSVKLETPPYTATVVPGPATESRHGHAAAVLANDEVWVFGPDPAAPLMHVNGANPGEWTVIDAPAGPGARRNVGAGMLATNDGNGFFLAGGAVGNAQMTNDVIWRFDAGSTNWTSRVATGIAPRPGQIALARLASDDSALVGVDGTASYVLDLSGTGAKWNRTDPPPAPRTDAAIAYDAANDRLFVFGGTDRDGTVLDDTWMVEPDRTASPWHRFQQENARPAPFANGSLAFDSRANVLYLAETGANGTEELWRLGPDGGGTWDQPWPTTHARHHAVLAVDHGADGERTAIWLVGGINGLSAQEATMVLHPGDANPQWTQVDAQQLPLVRASGREPLGCFDDTGRRVNMLGFSSTGDALDLWTLPLDTPTWVHLSTSPPPPATVIRALGCSTSEGSIYAILERAAGGAPVQEMWRVDVTGDSHVWAQVDSLSQGPGKLAAPAMVGTDWALWVFGGSGLAREPATFSSDLWRISLR